MQTLFETKVRTNSNAIKAQLVCAVLENTHRKFSLDIPSLHRGLHLDKGKQDSASVLCQDTELTLCCLVIYKEAGSSGMYQ